MRDARDIKNKTIQFAWSADKDIPLFAAGESKAKSVSGIAYSHMATQYPRHYSSNLSCAVQSASKLYKNSRKDIFAGVKSIPSFKNNQPIILHNKSISIYNEDEWVSSIKLFSQNYRKDLGLPSSECMFKLLVKDNSTRTILQRILSGEYRITESQLSYDKNKKKWFLSLGYNFEQKFNEPPYVPDECIGNIMGVDLGIVSPVYMSFSHCHNRYSISGKEVEAFRKRVEARRRSLKRQRKYCGDGSIGRGRGARVKPVLKIGDKIAKFRDAANHKYSRYIVNMAIKHKCGIIQMEDLTGISKDNLFLKNWDYFNLQTKIEYKAKMAGIKVIKINPKYTSQRCSKCGYIHKNNRETQSQFKCLSCNFKANADYNASQNIATENIEEIIANTIKS